MPKESKQGPQNGYATVPQANSTKKPVPQMPKTTEGKKLTQPSKTAALNKTTQQIAAPSSTAAPASVKKNRESNRSNKPRMGGTAVPGAKSTVPKEIASTNDPQQQQMASYNRDMRRRMQNLGTGPYTEESKRKTPQERRKEQIERRKQRLEEKRAELRKALPGGKVRIGRKNTYFLIGVIILVVLLIVAFVILRGVLHLF